MKVNNPEVVVLSGVRTAIGTYGGSLKNHAPTDLAGTVGPCGYQSGASWTLCLWPCGRFRSLRYVYGASGGDEGGDV